MLSSRLGKDARPRLNEFLREAEAEILPFGLGHVDAAVDAFLRYGKGRHPAGLNFGDCLINLRCRSLDRIAIVVYRRRLYQDRYRRSVVKIARRA